MSTVAILWQACCVNVILDFAEDPLLGRRSSESSSTRGGPGKGADLAQEVSDQSAHSVVRRLDVYREQGVR